MIVWIEARWQVVHESHRSRTGAKPRDIPGQPPERVPMADPPGALPCCPMPPARFTRTFIPAGPVTYYRLRIRLPLTVAFPSVSYVLQLQTIPAAGRHEIVALDAAAGTWWPVGPSYLAREFLERAVFEVGVPVRPATVGETIMRRLVIDGRAERMPAPSVDLSTMRTVKASHLGVWFDVPDAPTRRVGDQSEPVRPPAWPCRHPTPGAHPERTGATARRCSSRFRASDQTTSAACTSTTLRIWSAGSRNDHDAPVPRRSRE